MAWFHIVIAYCHGVVSKVVDHLGSYVHLRGVDKVGEIAHGLPLENVSVVKKQEVLAILLA